MRVRSPAMATLFSSLLLSLLLSSFLPSSSAVCSDETFSGGRTFRQCKDLAPLDASLHWTRFPANGSAAFAFRVKTDGWAAWGLNPGSSGMVGTQALVAVRNGATGISFFTTSLTSKAIDLVLGEISVSFSGLTAENVDGVITIYVTLVLPGNGTAVNHTWQKGSVVTAGVPGRHPLDGDHLRSFEVLELGTKTVRGGGGSGPAGSPASSPGGYSGSGPPGAPASTPGGVEGGRKVGLLSYFLLAAPMAGMLFL